MNKTTPTHANMIDLKQILNLIPHGMSNRHSLYYPSGLPQTRGDWQARGPDGREQAAAETDECRKADRSP